MPNRYELAARHRRKKSGRAQPQHRELCGTFSGAQAHYRAGEHPCDFCSQAATESNRRYNAINKGVGEFGKLPKDKWHLDEPFEDWRLLQTQELEDGIYIAGPWYSRIRVPLDQLEGPLDDDRIAEFVNGSAYYEFHHRDESYAYFEIVRRTIVSWLDIIEEKYGI